MAAWARAADDDATRIVAVMLENTKLAVNLLRDLDEAQRSGNDRKLAKVRRRLDRVLVALASRGASAIDPHKLTVTPDRAGFNWNTMARKSFDL